MRKSEQLNDATDFPVILELRALVPAGQTGIFENRVPLLVRFVKSIILYTVVVDLWEHTQDQRTHWSGNIDRIWQLIKTVRTR